MLTWCVQNLTNCARITGMARIKDKHIRLPGSALPMLEHLRELMKRTTSINGLVVNPIIKLGDGAVLSFALAMTNYCMNERFSVIDRADFADKLFVHLEPHMADGTVDEKRARMDLSIAAASQVSGYDAEGPLRATTPEGGVS